MRIDDIDFSILKHAKNPQKEFLVVDTRSGIATVQATVYAKK